MSVIRDSGRAWRWAAAWRLAWPVATMAAVLFPACGTQQDGVVVGQDDVDVSSPDVGDAGADPALDDEEQAHDSGTGEDENDVGDAAEDPDGPRDATPETPPDPTYIDELGPSGWRDSTEPFCHGPESGPGGVDVVAGSDRVVVARPPVVPADPWLVSNNAGEGWSDPRPMSSVVTVRRLVHTDGDRVWMLGRVGSQHGLFSTAVDVAEQPELAVADAVAAHVGPAESGVALLPGAPGVAVRRDGAWRPLEGDPLPFEPADYTAVWTDGTSITAVGRSGTVVSRQGSGWSVEDTPTLVDLTALDGDDDTLWAIGVQRTVLRRNDGTWEVLPVPASTDPGSCLPGDGSERNLNDLWFDGEQAYVAADGAVYTVGRTGPVTTLRAWPMRRDPETGDCEEFLSFSRVIGLSATEVFFDVRIGSDEMFRCEHYLLWYDGTTFRWF